MLALTGNFDLSKDALPKQVNFFSERGVGATFLKKILKKVDLAQALDNFEDRFLASGDKQFLLMVLQSLQKG